ncbi:MAG TPA: DapH/DapD/GlmU-related protein [Acidimicrobiales bacterium]
MPRLLTDAIQRAWAFAVRHGTIRPGSRQAGRFARFGEHSEITFPATVLMGEHRIEIGSRTLIGPHATLSAGMPATADEPGPPIVTIGDGCLLGKGIGIVGHERIEIADNVFTGHFVYVTDQNHGYEDVDVPIGLQLWRNAPVSIGAGSWLGHGAVVLPGTRIGAHTVVAAGAVVSGEFPDHCVLAGVPARVVRRHDGTAWVSATRDALRTDARATGDGHDGDGAWVHGARPG